MSREPYDPTEKVIDLLREIGNEQPTLRDRFAMAALAGLMNEDSNDDYVIKRAYQIADAMLRVREQQ